MNHSAQNIGFYGLEQVDAIINRLLILMLYRNADALMEGCHNIASQFKSVYILLQYLYFHGHLENEPTHAQDR